MMYRLSQQLPPLLVSEEILSAALWLGRLAKPSKVEAWALEDQRDEQFFGGIR